MILIDQANRVKKSNGVRLHGAEDLKCQLTSYNSLQCSVRTFCIILQFYLN